MKLEFSYFQLLLIILYLNYVKLVPDEYCLSPLNRSDCGTPPTPVFSYFKYGSRCEIETWRGCPTDNMFENEYHCSQYCIGMTKYYGREKGISIEDLSFKELEDVNKILHEIDDMDDEAKEKLDYVSPAGKPATKTTVKVKTKDTKTTVEARTEEDEPEEEYDEHDIARTTLVRLTQYPVTGDITDITPALILRQKKKNA
ncbi:uncharacterized protein LOC134649098 [Cydia amplana]|uniref:uncharacterized protein LOC134649098 n=1 Tax=Cydia amplana TaxID=1869771 RepID=UPI002FE5F3CE